MEGRALQVQGDQQPPPPPPPRSQRSRRHTIPKYYSPHPLMDIMEEQTPPTNEEGPPEDPFPETFRAFNLHFPSAHPHLLGPHSSYTPPGMGNEHYLFPIRPIPLNPSGYFCPPPSPPGREEDCEMMEPPPPPQPPRPNHAKLIQEMFARADSSRDLSSSEVNPQRQVSSFLTPLRDSHVGVAAMLAADDRAREKAQESARVMEEQGVAIPDRMAHSLMGEGHSGGGGEDYTESGGVGRGAASLLDLAQAVEAAALIHHTHNPQRPLGPLYPSPEVAGTSLAEVEQRLLDFRLNVQEIPPPRTYYHQPHPHPLRSLGDQNFNPQTPHPYMNQGNQAGVGVGVLETAGWPPVPLLPLGNTNALGPLRGGRRWSSGDSYPHPLTEDNNRNNNNCYYDTRAWVALSRQHQHPRLIQGEEAEQEWGGQPHSTPNSGEDNGGQKDQGKWGPPPPGFHNN